MKSNNKTNTNTPMESANQIDNDSLLFEKEETRSIRNMLELAKQNNYFIILKMSGTYKGISGYVKDISHFTATIESEDGQIITVIRISDIKAIQVIKK